MVYRTLRKNKTKQIELEYYQKRIALLDAEIAKGSRERLNSTILISLVALILTAMQFWIAYENQKTSESQFEASMIPLLINLDTRYFAFDSLSENISFDRQLFFVKQYRSELWLKDNLTGLDQVQYRKAIHVLEKLKENRTYTLKALFSSPNVSAIHVTFDKVNYFYKNDSGMLNELLNLSIASLKDVGQDKGRGVYLASLILLDSDESIVALNFSMIDTLYKNLLRYQNHNKYPYLELAKRNLEKLPIINASEDLLYSNCPKET